MMNKTTSVNTSSASNKAPNLSTSSTRISTTSSWALLLAQLNLISSTSIYMPLIIVLQFRSPTPSQPLSMMLWLPPLSKPSTFVLSILALLGSSSLYTIPTLPNTQKLLNQVQLNPLLLAPALESPSLSLALPTYPATPKTPFKFPTTL
jgi:hypothetical protein